VKTSYTHKPKKKKKKKKKKTLVKFINADVRLTPSKKNSTKKSPKKIAGTVLAQIGAGIQNAWFVYLGGLVATLFYAVCEERLFRPLWDVGHWPRGRDTADGALNVPYVAIAPVFAAVLIGALAVIEHYVPWKSD
jgi:hypothetical protein